MTRSSPRAVDVPPRVRIERTGAVAVLTLDDERRRNVLGPELRTRLRAALAELAADPGIGALVLTGAGGCFSGGGDLASITARGSSHRRKRTPPSSKMVPSTCAAA